VSIPNRLVLSLCCGALITVNGRAEAQEPPFPEGPPATAPGHSDGVERDAPRGSQQDSGSGFRPLALTLNPITLLLGRVGLNVEYMPAAHHGIMLNPYFSSASAETDALRTNYFSWGGELGYHFYTGKKGANGFFVGPSFVFTRTTMGTECIDAGCTLEPEIEFTTYGVAVDFGGQHVFDNGFTIGGGGGLMYLKSSASAGGGSFIKFEGTIPRMLFTIGYSI
jgi:hypothetical protein